ncbi:MAG TPA: NUDIX domain-containing protein [Desulfobacterales bacterium]|nr:NUDIX domain-containing protein [Desulfobacterales bacterium]
MIRSAGIVVVRKDKYQWKYLFLRSYRNWDFPKGVVEADETPLEAAKREVREETGISGLIFQWGNEFKETLPYDRGRKVARYYIANTTESKVVFSINPDLGKPEHHEYRWLSYDEIKRIAPERLLIIIEWASTLINDKIKHCIPE